MMGKHEYIEELAKRLRVRISYTTQIIDYTENLIEKARIDEYINYENLDIILSTLGALAEEKRLGEVVGVLSENFIEYFHKSTEEEISDRKAYKSSLGEKFRTYQEGGKEMIEGLIYPRFKGEVNLKGFLSAIDNIEILDKCNNTSELARAVRKAEDYLDIKRYKFR